MSHSRNKFGHNRSDIPAATCQTAVTVPIILKYAVFYGKYASCAYEQQRKKLIYVFQLVELFEFNSFFIVLTVKKQKSHFQPLEKV